jgi:hypothetical protein
MSVETWKNEFYPISARLAHSTDLMALQHSLKKWIGLRSENRKAHEVSIGPYNHTLQDASASSLKFHIASRSCALCHRHDISDEPHCATCPLYVVRGTRCDLQTSPTDTSQWHSWTKKANPEPMIQLIEQAIKVELEKK